MKFNRKIEHDNDLENVVGGKKVNLFGFESESGSYTKCDMCGSYHAIPLSNGLDTCLDCLAKLSRIIGQNNTFRLLTSPQKPTDPSIKPSNSAPEVKKDNKKS